MLQKELGFETCLRLCHVCSPDWSSSKRKDIPWFVGVDVELWCLITSGADLVNHHGKALWAYGLTSQLVINLPTPQDKGTEAVLDTTHVSLVKSA